MSSSSRIPRTLTMAQARKTVLALQGLYPPRKWQGKRGVKEYFQQVRSIQFDPINVVGRNPDLVLQSRVQDYRPEMLDELLYEDRYLVDNWDKMASLSLVEDWPYFARHRARMEDIFGIPSDVVMSLAPDMLEQIRREGPQCSLDYDFDRKTDWAWGPTRVARASLEGLFKMGKLGVHHRVNNRRYFDLIENLVPEEILNAADPNLSREEYQHWHVLRRVGALGLAHPNAGEQWGGIMGVKSARRRDIIRAQVDAGELLEVEIEELPGEQFYLRKDDEAILQEALEAEVLPQAALIAPLDNLLWDRKSVSRLFDFNYMWEVYKPQKKRQYGYYVLPVLYMDRFVARLDPAFDRESAALTIQDWWWEPGVEITRDLIGAVKDCLADFLHYLDAKELRLSSELRKKRDLEWLVGL
ncbi:MAG: winged helix-turn-helix domain-containing protein [Anaerolineales bacterium]